MALVKSLPAEPLLAGNIGCVLEADIDVDILGGICWDGILGLGRGCCCC